MDLTQFKTVEQLAAAIKTMISGTLSLTGLNVGSVGSVPASGEIKATSHIRTDGGVYAGNKAGSVSNDQIRADGDISTAGGVYAGSATGNPGTGEVTATGDIRTDGGIYAGNKAGTVGNDDIVADGDIYTVAWTDYSGTSSITGWSSYSTKDINYKKVGDLVCVAFYIDGTSDSVAVEFSLPYAAASGVAAFIGSIFVRDNGVSQSALGYSRLLATESTIKCGMTGAAIGGFTASGQKIVGGQIWYETA